MKAFKRSVALILSFMLIFSMCMISVSAAETEETSSVVYLKPNSNWLIGNARFAMYVFNSKTNAWADMADEDEDGYYEGTIPEGDWTGIILCRMNPNTTTNSWSNKRNQTSDLTVPEGMNCYTVKEGTWDKGGGTWSLYTPGVEPTTAETEPTTEQSFKYSVAGDAGLCGSAWDPADAANAMTDEDGDGVYEITYKDVPAGTYSFKVTNGTWNSSWGEGTGNCSVTLNKTSDVTIKFNETTKKIEIVSDGAGEFVLQHMTVVGDEELVGAKWDPDAAEGIMSLDENGVWTITFKNVAAGTYSYKFVANNSYTYNWTVEGYFNSSLNSEIVVENDNSDVTLTIDVSAYDFNTKKGTVTATANVTCDNPTEPTESTDPTEPTEPTQPVTTDYYLFGTINGENYGCEEDWKNIGDYKFVDGKLSAVFDSVSYVAVKTGDNTGWYMTDGWAGITKSVTLYSTSLLGEDANKLIVPEGKVDFTLVKNEDGTLTLSYESENEPVIPTEPVTDPTEPSEPVTDPTEPVTEPTTAPATEPTQPTTEEPSDGTTLYMAAPVFKEGTTWDEIYLTYSSTSNVSTATKLPMVKTDRLYYVSGVVAGSLSTNANWAVYKITLTDEQVAAINASNYAGFTDKFNSLRTNYVWSNSIFRANTDAEGYKAAKTPVEDLNGKMFVIKDAASLTNKASFLGNWVSENGSPCAGVYYAASPVVNETTAMGDVYFRYGTSSTPGTAVSVRMLKTDYDYVNTADCAMLQQGKWTVYKLELTAEQMQAADACNYTGFTSAYGAEIRTDFTYSHSVTRAKVGEYNAKYNSAKTAMADLNSKMFFFIDSAAQNTRSYLGYWGEYKGSIKTVTIRVAAPNEVNGVAISSLKLAYGSGSELSSAKFIEMTATNEAFAPDSIETSLISNDATWTVYEAVITADQYNEINKVTRFGVVSGDSKLRTLYSWSGNLLRAGIGSYEYPYDTTTTATVESLNGAMFVINGCAPQNKLVTMTGYWAA